MKKLLVPKQFLFRLTLLNIIVITAFIGLSSWAIYNTACMLADGLVAMNNQQQTQFEATLLQYLFMFSISTIVIGSLTHFYLTRKLVHPLRELVYSTKELKRGVYPDPIVTKSDGEIAETIHHFNDLIQQLKANEESRQKIVSDLSHEFRTPLANLNGYLRALQTGVIEGDEKLYESLYQESKQLIYLVERIEQLKEWDHVSNQAFIEKSPVNMKEIIDQAVEMFRWALEKKGLNINVDVAPAELLVHSGQLTQVISNLIENAIRYYEDEDAKPIVIKGINRSTVYELSVTGPGKPITQHEANNIFERFYRIDSSRSREFGGSGLGLAISKEIVEYHGGTIGVYSEENMHTFWFKLPKE